ncbi:MAG: hypothetical protein E6K91_03535 [Thaumarchaeota archaeon]|nr:MAG: hypothetical protein E6K91_03535 [Nitrososphaerota archaeon]
MCKKEIGHGHRPKSEWQIQGRLCGDCYVDQMKKFYESNLRQRCVICEIERYVSDMWEPRYQWNMKGLLCKTCFDKKDEAYQKQKTFCSICGKKLGMIRYNPKKQWAIQGQLCRECWDSQKTKLG